MAVEAARREGIPLAVARSPWVSLIPICLGVFMTTLDTTMVNVALGTIRDSLRTTLPATQWVASAYLITLSVVAIPVGRVGDLLGRRRVFVGGIVVFSVASALCGLATSLPLLIPLRVLQAFGAGAVVALGTAIITDLLPPEKRGTAFGVVQATLLAGYLLGPSLGGLILHYLSWRAIFVVNVPLGVLAVVIATAVLPVTPPGEGRVDVGGMLLFAAAALSLLLGFNFLVSPERRAVSPFLFAGLAVAGVGFIAWERRAASPMVALELFRNRVFSLGVVAMGLANVGMWFYYVLLPVYLSHAHGLSLVTMGQLMSVGAACNLSMSLLAGWLSDRVSPRLLAVAGNLVCATGYTIMSLVAPTEPLGSVLARMVVCTAGAGLFFPPNNRIVMNAIGREGVATASGVLQTARNMGLAMGVSLAVVLLAWRGGSEAGAARFMPGFTFVLHVSAVIALVNAGLSALNRPIRTPAAPPARQRT